ncbi:GntR family transcriptional regulator/MocR family aminotransferase [Pelomonas saccharophila]|uniref:GntR family transcriptional regulator/MocR family aminotransferase n=1 Tax=Roseateles saccharophilus TaxID=304 RepID=A0ABU1YPR4_ROSSA|nr:PLP-dependent aminotransferase family protein [Roseateles saccharophilus]MDR7270852.1 GntR family transcriptional regulator/MocR family aminotransferase [Roseateles saccharophilus]
MLSDRLAATLRRDSPIALSAQLAEELRRLIASAVLRPGDALPATRALATDLGLGRNTVIEAYERLTAEGYLQARRGAGSFVAAQPPAYEMQAPPGNVPVTSAALSLSRRATAILAEPSIEIGRAFALCTPDLGLLRLDVWQRLLAQAWREARLPDTGYAEPGGHPLLRHAIADHVRLTRLVRCTPEQVIVVAGAQQGLDLCARLLADAGEQAWAENPGYPGARRAFAAAGLHMQPITVDDQGLAPTEADWRQPPRLIYTTPSHQFPTGVEMSLARRLALLGEAARHACWVIEDDYDGEFRLAGAPVPSLQGMDAADRVVYVGTFSKVLFPALRLGYVIVPPALATGFAEAAARLQLEGRQLTQLALARFIEEGHFAAHIRRMRQAYAARREILAAAWARELGKAMPLIGTETGMHVSVALPAAVEAAVIAQLAQTDIVVQPLSHFGVAPLAHHGLALGYGGAHDQEVRDQGARLARLVAGQLRQAP